VGYSQSVHAQRVFIYGVTVTSLLNLQARPSGNHVQLSWPANAGTIYQLQSTTNLSAASWINEGAAVNGSGGVMTTNIPVSSAAQKFFRLQLLNN